MSKVQTFQSFSFLRSSKCESAIGASGENMARRLCQRTLGWLLVALAVLASAWGQVTFSRDWNPGKRSPLEIPCNAVFRSTEEVCKILVDQFRQVAACETRSLMHYQKDLEEKHGDMFLERPEGR